MFYKNYGCELKSIFSFSHRNLLLVQPCITRFDDRRGPVSNLQLAEDRGNLVAHRFGADGEAFCIGIVGQPFGDQA